MNYSYDITLNFNRNLYEFYEWREEDNPEFILKIPTFKVGMEDFLNIKNNDIIVNKSFLNTILDKTEVYTPTSVNIIRYACIFLCNESVIAIEFDLDGNNHLKSSISIDEEDEILESMSYIKYTILDYKIKNKRNIKKEFITRDEKEVQKYLLKSIEQMKNNNEYLKLRYIFYEIYNEKLEDIDKIYSKLINITNNKDNKFIKLKDIIYLIDNKKIVSNN